MPQHMGDAKQVRFRKQLTVLRQADDRTRCRATRQLVNGFIVEETVMRRIEFSKRGEAKVIRPPDHRHRSRRDDDTGGQQVVELPCAATHDRHAGWKFNVQRMPAGEVHSLSEGQRPGRTAVRTSS